MPKIKSRERTTEQLTEDLRKIKEELAIQKWGNKKTLEGMKVLVKEIIQRNRELAEAKAKDEAILESIGDAVMACNKDGNMLIFNKAAEELTGYSTSGVTGRHYRRILKFVRESDEKPGNDFIAEAIATGQTTKMVNHTVLIRNDGQKIPVADSAAPIKNVQGEIVGCVVVFRDVSKEREIDRAKSEFITVASHQLRTPMTSIQWVIERFLKTEHPTKKGAEYLNDIHTAVARLSSLVDLLLNVSRIEADHVGLTPAPLEVVGFIKNYLRECEPLAAEKKLRLQFNIHPVTFNAVTDRVTLRNIIHALVSNSLEYTPEGGEVELAILKRGDTFRVTVRDTGIGIPHEEQRHVFEKFFRGSNAKLLKTDGTGLGLYIAAQATKLLGGRIWFESAANKGSTFYVELPIESRPAEGGKRLT